MTVVRRVVAGLAATAIAAIAAVLPAGAASAHGTTTQPVSRTAACTPGAAQSVSAACKAASEANGGPFGNFDNLRVPGVNGLDKQYIPDGNLCSGDLPEFAGLDLPRADWPATKAVSGRTLDIRYAGTIPHAGTFRVYLTRQGYDPLKPLGWGDLDAEPFLTVKDPPLTDGAYRMSATLPGGRTGRHVLYVVWQNSGTPDTYYACSDLQLTAAAAAAEVKSTAKPAPVKSRTPEPGAVATPLEESGTVTGLGAPAAEESWIDRTADDVIPPGQQLASAALIVAAGLSAAVAVSRIRRARRTHDG